ncbi:MULTISPECIES: hypothetical protein [unclassified Streptomyces]|uniref:hypothetical protein n=1 Tax=unclassified Streptomyces TaxID=2593676 RepID=UPI0003669770|nr:MULTISPECIES: hypothetical protein [unclassified Streptomyces]MYT30070.1 hypothetical protein [Streptomyces sp. SID8354]
MRKFHKVAVVAAALGSVGAFGAGTAYAHGEAGAHDTDLTQGTECRSHDMNISVLGTVGALDGTLGNALNGEGSPGAQHTHQGANFHCSNGVS